MIVIIGGKGMLGSSLMKYSNASILMKSIDRDTFGDLQDFDRLENELNMLKPKVIINCAAIVNLEKCKNDNTAFEINVTLVSRLANYCERAKAKLIQISTDHFFNPENKTHKNTEIDPVILLNDYAKQKFYAEGSALCAKSSLIIRCCPIGFNIRKTSLLDWLFENAKKNNNIRGFDNAITTALDCYSLSKIILKLISLNAIGIINVGCKEAYSKYTLACDIYNLESSHGSVTRSELENNGSIERAKSLALSTEKVENEYKIKMPSKLEVIKNIKWMRENGI